MARVDSHNCTHVNYNLKSPWVMLTFHFVHHLHGLPKQLLCLCLDAQDSTALLTQHGTLPQPVLQLCIPLLESLEALER